MTEQLINSDGGEEVSLEDVPDSSQESPNVTPSFGELVAKARRVVNSALDGDGVPEDVYKCALEVLKLAQKGGDLDASSRSSPRTGRGSFEDGLRGPVEVDNGNLLRGSGDRFRREIDRSGVGRNSGDRED